MKCTLMIEAAPAVIASILASLPDGAVASAPAMPSPAPMMPGATPAMPQNPGPGGDGNDDDNGPINALAPAVDVNSLPWDERIHAKTKTTKADGSWTRKRGADDALVAAVEAELRARGPAQPAPVVMQQPVPMPIPMAQPMQPVAMPMPQPQPMPMPQPVPMAQPMPMPQPEQFTPPVQMQPAPVQQQPIPVVQSGTLDFAQFMSHMSGQMNKRDANGSPMIHADYLAGITQEISTAFAPHGFPALTAITDIANNPQMIEYAVGCMTRDGRWQ